MHTHTCTQVHIYLYIYIYICVCACVYLHTRLPRTTESQLFLLWHIFCGSFCGNFIFTFLFSVSFFVSDGLNWFLADIKQLAKYYIFVWLGNTQTSLYVWGLYLNSCNRLWTAKSINRIYLINIYLLQCQQCLERVFMAYSTIYVLWIQKMLKKCKFAFSLKI